MKITTNKKRIVSSSTLAKGSMSRLKKKKSIKSSTRIAANATTSMVGKDFRIVNDALSKQGFVQTEYGDTSAGTGYAIYEKGNRRYDVEYEWIPDGRPNGYTAGKVLSIFDDSYDPDGILSSTKPGRTDASTKKKYTVKAARTPKTIEVAILQGNYGYGWDDLFEFEKGATYSEIKKAKKEYDENEPQYAHRIIHRRVPNPEYQQTSNDTSGTGDVKSSTSIEKKYNRTLKNPGPNKVNVQPYRGDYAVVVGLENGGYAYNTYLTEFTAKNEAETFRHYVQKFGADETADQWEFQKVEACDNSVTAHTKTKNQGWNYTSDKDTFAFLYNHKWYTGPVVGNKINKYKSLEDCVKGILDTLGTSTARSANIEIIRENSAGYTIETWDANDVKGLIRDMLADAVWDLQHGDDMTDVTSCDNSVTASRIDVDNFDNTYEPDDFSQDPEGMGYEENKAVALVDEILDEYQSRTPTKLDPSIVDECYAYAHDYERSPSELADIVYSILDEAYPELVEACDCVNASVYTNPGTNKTPVESNVEYYQALADGVVALLDKNLNDGYVYKIRAEVTPEAITFLDDDNNIYWIQSGKDIIPNWDDLQDDIDELYGVVYMNAIPQF